jgi:hypothetical protein
VAVFFPCEETFRKSAERINRLLWRQEKTDQVQSRTLANLVEREGKAIQEKITKKAANILKGNGFSTDGELADRERTFEPVTEAALLPQATVSKTIEELNTENPEATTYYLLRAA